MHRILFILLLAATLAGTGGAAARIFTTPHSVGAFAVDSNSDKRENGVATILEGIPRRDFFVARNFISDPVWTIVQPPPVTLGVRSVVTSSVAVKQIYFHLTR